MNFKFGGNIRSVNLSKRPLKILDTRRVGISRDCPIFAYPILSQEQVKLSNSNFVRTFTGLLGTKLH